jgi:hypothetical protein
MFEIGDKVVVSGCGIYDFCTGETGTITAFKEVGPIVLPDNKSLKYSKHGYCVVESQLTLLSDSSKLVDVSTKVIPIAGGHKADDVKIPCELLPPVALIEIAKVLQFGSKKYAAWNWAKGLSYTRVLGAILRHVFAYLMGEDKDPETGLSHVAHAACECLFILHYEKFKPEFDDRFRQYAATTTNK